MGKSCLDLSGKVAVVFGASSGLGKAISLGLAEHGADVVPTARRAEMVAEVGAQIGGAWAQDVSGDLQCWGSPIYLQAAGCGDGEIRARGYLE